MLYLKGQCSEVISPSLVMMPSPKYSHVITHTQRERGRKDFHRQQHTPT